MHPSLQVGTFCHQFSHNIIYKTLRLPINLIRSVADRLMTQSVIRLEKIEGDNGPVATPVITRLRFENQIFSPEEKEAHLKEYLAGFKTHLYVISMHFYKFNEDYKAHIPQNKFLKIESLLLEIQSIIESCFVTDWQHCSIEDFFKMQDMASKMTALSRVIDTLKTQFPLALQKELSLSAEHFKSTSAVLNKTADKYFTKLPPLPFTILNDIKENISSWLNCHEEPSFPSPSLDMPKPTDTELLAPLIRLLLEGGAPMSARNILLLKFEALFLLPPDESQKIKLNERLGELKNIFIEETENDDKNPDIFSHIFKEENTQLDDYSNAFVLLHKLKDYKENVLIPACFNNDLTSETHIKPFIYSIDQYTSKMETIFRKRIQSELFIELNKLFEDMTQLEYEAEMEVKEKVIASEYHTLFNNFHSPSNDDLFVSVLKDLSEFYATKNNSFLQSCAIKLKKDVQEINSHNNISTHKEIKAYKKLQLLLIKYNEKISALSDEPPPLKSLIDKTIEYIDALITNEPNQASSFLFLFRNLKQIQYELHNDTDERSNAFTSPKNQLSREITLNCVTKPMFEQNHLSIRKLTDMSFYYFQLNADYEECTKKVLLESLSEIEKNNLDMLLTVLE